MPFDRWGYHFKGLFQNAQSLSSGPGVYVIWCKENDHWTVLDVGESENVRDRVSNHDRAECWRRNCSGTIYYSAIYTFGSEEERRRIEQDIRSRTNPPCGEL